jgi:hypothetical protein
VDRRQSDWAVPAKTSDSVRAKVRRVRLEHIDRLRRIVEEGEGLTPVVLAGVVLVVVAPLAALLILLVDGVAHFA